MRNFRLFAAIAMSMLMLVCAFVISAAADTTDTASTQTQSITFWDISDDAAYKDAVYKLVSNGVLNGYPDGSFRPNGNLTRAEMCKMINLTFGYTDTEGAAGFPDLVEGEWYVPYVLAAQKAGYVEGDAAGTFRPQDNISREEVCAILYRIIKPYDLPIPVTINDAVSDWARPYVEAMVKNALIPLEAGGIFRATEPIKRFELASAVAPHSNIKVDDIKCKVTFMNGQTAEQTLEVSIGKGIEVFPTVNSVPYGYKFGGWSRSEQEPVLVDSSFVFLENTTLYAYFDKLEYNVKFVIDSTNTVSEIKVKYAEFAVKPVDPQKSGYTFKGWSTNGSNLVDVATYGITQDTVFTAVFEKVTDTGGGYSGSPSRPSTPSKPSTPSTGTDDDDDSTTGDTGDTGKEDEDVVISYRVDFIVDGEQFGETQIIEKGKCPEKPEEPTLEGYTFLYWALEEDGERVDVRYLEIYEDTKLYAVFALEETNPNDPAIIAALKKAAQQFSEMRLSDLRQQEVREIVIETIGLVLADAEEGKYIDSDYVKDNYQDNLKQVRQLLNSEMEKSERSDFISRVNANVDEETFNILADFFLSEETKEDYLG